VKKRIEKEISLMRIEKSPCSGLIKPAHKEPTSPFNPRKHFQIRTYRTGKREPNKRDKTRTKKTKEHTMTVSHLFKDHQHLNSNI